MPLSVAELQPVLHDLFSDTADHLARRSGFCRRARKLTGPVFAQAVVFSLLHNPNATLDDFAEVAEEVLGVPVTAQAFDKRFNPCAPDFLRDLFLEAFNRSFESLRPALLPVLRHFTAVFLRDGTLVSLPPALAHLFPGRGGLHAPGGKAAAVKLVFEAEVTTGALTEASILAGLDNEKLAEVSGKPLPKGALLLEDMGFFSGERLQAYADQGVYVLTRIPAWTAVFDLKGRRLDLVQELRRLKGDYLDREVRILHDSKVKVRLLAVRLAEEEAQKRRERVRQEAKQRGRPVSQKKLDLCAWNILVTNAPARLLSPTQACVVRRVRWQIELVFKVFKSEGKIAETRSKCPQRALGELYAKLLGMVVQQGALLAAGYQVLKHSARRASRRVRKRALNLLKGSGRIKAVGREIARLAKELHRRCRVARRKAGPSTFDLLIDLDPEFDELRAVA
jgi:Transposase DDE domain